MLNYKRFYLLFFIGFLVCDVSFANQLSPSLLLRYENDNAQTRFGERKRIRAIGRVAYTHDIDDFWHSEVSVRTGLKNHQNVPAVTLFRISDQPQPDTDVYIDRFYLTRKTAVSSLFIGKLPWQFKHASDTFWDRDLNPIGVHTNVKLSPHRALAVAHLKPLDGASRTVGTLNVVQYQHQFTWGNWRAELNPWLVFYEGESDARFALNDTQFDHRSARLSAIATINNWTFGADIGHTFSDVPEPTLASFEDDKDAFTLLIQSGDLKHVGHVQFQARYLYVERFGVISEFAQNATSRFATSNFKGVDFRVRKKLSQHWWLGARISRVETITGDEQKGTRFRLEAQFN